MNDRERRPVSDGLPMNRRDVLRMGGAAGLAALAGPVAPGVRAAGGAGFGRARSCLIVFLAGGPSHLDTFDPKPDAPAEVRGPFRSIATAVPGLRVCEHLPRLARLADRFTLVRSNKNGRRVTPKEEVETHRIKGFSIFLTAFKVDYDDPLNFLTAHRVRFMGGERVAVTERSWFVWTGFLVLAILYIIYGAMIWRLATVPDPPAMAFVALAFMILITFPLTVLYLYVIFPNFLGNTTDHPILDD